MTKAYWIAVVVSLMTFSLASYSAPKEFKLIPPRIYLALSPEKQKSYIEEVRRAMYNFELGLKRSKGFAYNSFANLLMDQAWAQGAWGPKCVVGGFFRATVNGYCPTRGRSCPGQSDGFKCGQIFGSVCVPREPIDGQNGLSKRCFDEGKKILVTPEQYLTFKTIIEAEYSQTCSSPPPGSVEPCELLLARMKELDGQQNGQVAPLPPIVATKAEPDAAQQTIASYSVDPQNRCSLDRDQGLNATCHAFCLTCVFDHAITEVTKKPSKVSANWITLVSIASKMCENQEAPLYLPELLLTGGSPSLDLEVLTKVGVCQEDQYHKYNGASGLEAIEKFRGRFSTKDVSVNQTFEFDDEMWKENFGIDGLDAYILFCPNNNQTANQYLSGPNHYAETLERLKRLGRISEKFYRCAKEGLSMATSLTGNQAAHCAGTPPSENRIDQLKNALKSEQRPVPVGLVTDDEGHQFHCVTVTGWNEEKQEFNLVNSWGPQFNLKTLPYNQTPRITELMLPSCAVPANRKAPRGPDLGAPKGKTR